MRNIEMYAENTNRENSKLHALFVEDKKPQLVLPNHPKMRMQSAATISNIKGTFERVRRWPTVLDR